MTDPVSVVVPARNEAATIGKLIERLVLLPWVDDIVVVDNASGDGTGAIARDAGARCVRAETPGMGNALRAGFAAARNDWVLKLDADLCGLDLARLALMVTARAAGVGLVKGVWHEPGNDMAMTRLVVRPALRRLFPALGDMAAPNSGVYLFNRALIAHREITGDFAADLDVLTRVHAAGARITEVDIGRIEHDPRDPAHYAAQAETLLGFLFDLRDRRIGEDLVVLAEDAAGIIPTALGLVAARSRDGGPVTICLARHDDPAADVLKAALAPFPSVRVLPLTHAPGLTPIGPEGRLRFVAPFPAAQRNRSLRVALAARARLVRDPTIEADMMLMPLARGRAVIGAFRPDLFFDVSRGIAIKQPALDRLRQIVFVGEAASGAREAFQSYGSLPEPLKAVLQSAERIRATAR